MNDDRTAVKGDRAADEPERSAAGWFVTFDSGNADGGAEREFAEWIREDPAHEAELARCEAAICLAARLRSDPDMRKAFEEIEPLVARRSSARRSFPAGRRIAAPRALVAAAASIALVMLGAFVFSTLRSESPSLPSRGGPAVAGDTPAPADDRLQGEVSLRSTAPGARTLDELLERAPSPREAAHFDAYPLDALVVYAVVSIPGDPSKSRVRVEMPDGTVADARLGDYLGEEDLRIIDVTTTAVVLEDGTRVELARPERR